MSTVAEWRDVPGLPGYEASSEGQVRSKPRTWSTGIGTRSHDGVLMSRTVDTTTGYMRVKVRLNGRPVMRYVHRLVAAAFHPNPQGLPAVNHLDGIKTNCGAANLEWCTHSRNNQHAWDMGLNTYEKCAEGKRRAASH